MRARERGSEWVGGKLTMPAYVMDGDPYRPEMILWLELPDDLIVGSALIDPKAPAVRFSQTLLDSMKKPMVGAPRRPTRIRVADPALAAELRSAIPDVEVVLAPTPELDAVVAHMARTMSASDRSEESYLEGGHLLPAAVEKLFRAAELLYKLAPWKLANDGQVLRLDIPQLGVAGAAVSIIGALGESRGFLIFPSLHGYDAFLRAAESRRRGPPDLGTTVLSLTFERGADLPSSMRKEVARHGWRVADPNAYPHVEHRDRDGMPRPLSEHDVRIAAACATSLCTFFIRHRVIFERDEAMPVCETYTDENDLEVRFTAPYDAHDDFEIDEPPRAPVRRAEPKVPRNAPCPCGSGKKYKKCCLAKDQSAPADGRPHIHEVDERLVHEMANFADRRFGAKWRRSMRDFADAEASMQLHLPWSVYGFLVEERPIVDWFVADRGARLSSAERAWLDAQRRSWMTIWEVIAVEPGRGLTVRDLLSSAERHVHEVSGSKLLKVRDALLGRVVDHEGLSVFCGIHPRPLGPLDADEVVRSARRRLRVKGTASVEQLRDEAFGRYLIKRWERATADADLRASMPPTLLNTDSEPFLLTTDHFTFDAAKRTEVEARLLTIEGVEPLDENESGRWFTFLKAGNALHKSWETTVIGRAVVADGELRLETNSVERADELRRRLETPCGGMLRHVARDHSDPLSRVARSNAKPSKAEPAIPPTEAAALLRQYKERHYLDWLDQPVPALAGKTPRQAARSKTGRAKLDLLLRDIENHEARVDDGERFDFSRIRRELNLEE